MNLFEQQVNEFARRHIGSGEAETRQMLQRTGNKSLDELIDKTIPQSIRTPAPLQVTPAISEYEYLKRLREIASLNKVFKNYIGQGYYDTITPSVILRNVLKTLDGIPSIHLTRLKFPRAAWKAC